MLMEAVGVCAPLTIGAMCVERYVAICMPLRHHAISTSRRALMVILMIWILSSINPFVDMFILISTASHEYLTQLTHCHYEIMVLEKIPRAASGDMKSASKGQRTISLHILQLFLCTAEVMCPYIEAVVMQYDINIYLIVRCAQNDVHTMASQNASGSVQLQLIQADPVRRSISLALTQIFVWPFVYLMVVMLLMDKANVFCRSSVHQRLLRLPEVARSNTVAFSVSSSLCAVPFTQQVENLSHESLIRRASCLVTDSANTYLSQTTLALVDALTQYAKALHTLIALQKRYITSIGAEHACTATKTNLQVAQCKVEELRTISKEAEKKLAETKAEEIQRMAEYASSIDINDLEDIPEAYLRED
ncbi:diablo mitochondrial-like isoform X1 [Labeo rohita]|uniref:Diablo mitochondrial-like isoform X1 n=1 Tax=Labeo rohita TaxID=84645 RepID=A0A498LDV1_LABRO|nr:diablo mitochondrial-like isoform X1 [Labeo rohita]